MASLHRYPVKSLLGEECPALALDARGVVGDRAWAVRTADGGIGSGKATRRFRAVPGLLDLRAHGTGAVRVALPDGRELAVDDPALAAAVSAHVGQPVVLAPEDDVSLFDDGPVSLLGLASVRAVEAELGGPVDPARFRANVLLDLPTAYAEDAWVGRRVQVGTAVLRVTMTSARCRMVDAATADAPAQPGVLLATGRAHRAELGVIAEVVVPGRAAPGDAVRVVG